MAIQRFVIGLVRILNTLFYVFTQWHFIEVAQVNKANLASLICKQQTSKLISSASYQSTDFLECTTTNIIITVTYWVLIGLENSASATSFKL